jgi:tetratricopeptide (TPR) repeat protein
MAQAGLGDEAAAIADYSKSIQLNDQDASVYVNRGLAYASQDKPDAAITDYNTALDLNPNDPRAYHSRGIIKIANEAQRSEAQADLKKAAQLYLKQGDRENYSALQALIK